MSQFGMVALFVYRRKWKDDLMWLYVVGALNKWLLTSIQSKFSLH